MARKLKAGRASQFSRDALRGLGRNVIRARRRGRTLTVQSESASACPGVLAACAVDRAPTGGAGAGRWRNARAFPCEVRRRAVIRAETRIGRLMQTVAVSSEVAGPVQFLLLIEYDKSGRIPGQLGCSQLAPMTNGRAVWRGPGCFFSHIRTYRGGARRR